MIIYAGTDPRINAMWPDYEAALRANGVTGHTNRHTLRPTVPGLLP